MHLANGAISPSCAALGFAAAAAGSGLVWLTEHSKRTEPREPERERGPRAFVAICVLALGLQELQIPAPSGSFAVHLLGGVLAVWQLGALRGVAAMATVLAVQALLLHDGALSAYGVHVVAMGIVPALCLRVFGRSPARAAFAAACSVWIAAEIVGLVALSGNAVSQAEMLRSHLTSAFVEASITAAAVVALTRTLPQRAALGGELR